MGIALGSALRLDSFSAWLDRREGLVPASGLLNVRLVVRCAVIQIIVILRIHELDFLNDKKAAAGHMSETGQGCLPIEFGHIVAGEKPADELGVYHRAIPL